MHEFQPQLGDFVERLKPSVVVETGFMTGESAKFMLAAMDKNDHGKLYSIEPFATPSFVHSRLNFVHGYSYQKMEEVYNQTGPWDLFLHDSNHDVGCMTFELELAYRYAKPGGVIVCDDYTWGLPPHNAWQKFCARHSLTAIHQLGSCQYIIKPPQSPVPVADKGWSRQQWEESAAISDAASVEYGDKPIFAKSKQMKTLCLTLHETPERTATCKKHFEERGINADFVYGFHAGQCGLRTENNYEVDAPGSKYNIGPHGVGIWTSMIMMYQIMSVLPDEHVFLLEHDAKFDPDWRERFDQAMKDVPPDFDFLFMGHCCVDSDNSKRHINGQVWQVRRPYCNHACVIAKKCLPFVIKALTRKCWAPVDIQLVNEVFPYLKVYALVPRLATQFDTDLKP